MPDNLIEVSGDLGGRAGQTLRLAGGPFDSIRGAVENAGARLALGRSLTVALPFGLLTLVPAHSTFCIAVACNDVVARLRRLSPNGGRSPRPRRW